MNQPTAQPRTQEALVWRVCRTPEARRSLTKQWNELAHGSALSPTADAIWSRCFWRAFERNSDSLAVHALVQGDRPLAILPLESASRGGRCWHNLTNAHLPYWMCAHDEERTETTAHGLLEHLLTDHHGLVLEAIHSDQPFCRALIAAAKQQGLLVITENRSGDNFLDLPASFEEYRQSLSKNTRTQTERGLRRLQRLGELHLERLGASQDLERWLPVCFAMEAKGWKGRAGSAMIASDSTHRFYRDLAHESAAAGRAALYLLTLDGKVIAFMLCIRGQGRLNMLKMSHDPDFSSHSPGNGLFYRIVQHEIEAGEIHRTHLGHPAPWKNRFTKQVAPLCRLSIYKRSARGRLAYLTGPRLREEVRRRKTLHGWINRLRHRLLHGNHRT